MGSVVSRSNRGGSCNRSFVLVRHLFFTVLLSLLIPFLLYAVDLNKNLLPDDWELAHGFSAGAYAETNLIGWWQLDETNGISASDRSSNNLALTVISPGSNTWTTNGLFYGAAQTDGVGRYLQAQTNSAYNLTNFTFSVWVNTASANDNQVIAQWVNTSGYGWRVDTATNGQVRARFDTPAAASQIFQSASQPPLSIKNGGWHHVALTYANTNHLAQVYVDGMLEAQGTVSGDVDSTVANFVVGQADGANWWAGLIDEVRLYNRVLSINEIGLLPETYTDGDVDGLTNWQEYQAGSDPQNSDTDGDGIADGSDSYPADYYNNVLPTLTKVSGDGQVTALSSFATNPLVVQVKDASNSALINAPVTFTVTTGTGKLATTGTGAPQTFSTVTVRTDASGSAQVYFQAGAINGKYDQITAQVQSGALMSQAAFTEKALTGADALSLWLKADMGVTTSSGSVTQWLDQSSSGHILSQSSASSRPLLQTGTISNQIKIQFNGNQNLYSNALLPCNQDITVLVVSSVNNTTYTNDQYTLVLGTNQAGRMRGFGYSPSTLNFANWGGGVSFGKGPNPLYQTLTAYVLTRSSSLIQGYVSGVDVGTGNAGSGQALTTLSEGITAGCLNAASYYRPLYGTISEIVVFNRVLNSSELSSVSVYLADRYEIYHPNASWITQYSSAVQSEITRNQWNKEKADAYANYLQNNPTLEIPAAGLSLWMRADAGITIDANNNVSQWQDQSFASYLSAQATVTNSPKLVNDAQTGKAALSFSGNQWLNGTTTLPVNQDITIITLASNATPSVYSEICAIGVSPSATGRMRGYGYQNSMAQFDVYQAAVTTGSAPIAGRPVIASVLYSKSSGVVSFYMQGVANGAGGLSTSDVASGFIFGRAGWVGAYWNGTISEILVYNRQLSSSERLQAEVYLSNKYGVYHPNATWPLAYSSAVQSTITRNQWNKVEADAYVAMQQNNTGVMTNGLKAWFKADAGVTQSGGYVSSWTDQSGNYTATQSTANRQPAYIASAVNGKPGLRFSGGQCLYSGNTLGAGANADMTLIVVSSTTNPGAQQYAVFSGGSISSRGRSLGYLSSRQVFDTFNTSILGGASPTSNTFVIEQASINAALNNIIYYRNGLQTATASIAGVGMVTPGLMLGASPILNGFWQGDISEVLIYDHQLNEIERKQIETYLGNKYAISTPLPVIVPDGGIYRTAPSVTLYPPTGAVAYFTLDGSEPTLDSSLYAAPFAVSANATLKVKYYYGNGLFSGTATSDFIIDSNLPITTAGLNLWLRADRGVVSNGSNNVSLWKDQSGSGMHAGQTLSTAQPVLNLSGANSRPTVTLNGTSSYLQCPAGFADLTQGVTAFVVARPTSTGDWARFFDFGIGAGNNNIFLARSGSSQDFAVTLMNGGTSRNLYGIGILSQNTVQVLSITAEATSSGYIKMYKDSRFINQTVSQPLLNITKTTNYIGKSNWNNALFQGDIAEVLFYNRKLDDLERIQVDTYLGEKYGTPVYLPSVTPDGGIFKTPLTVSVSSLSGAIAYYTVDGTDPSLSSQSYSAPFVVSNSATVKVRYYYGASPCSGMASINFIIDPDLPIATSSLSLWLRADIGVVKDGANKVSVWKDQSGSGMHAAQTLTTAQPTLGTLGTYGKPTLTLDGATNFLQCPTGFADLTNGISAFVVMRSTAVKNYARFFDFGNGAGSNNIFMSRMGTSQDCLYQNMNGGSVRNYSGPGVIVQNAVRVLSVTDDATSSGLIKMYADGQIVGQAASQPLLNIAKIYNYIGKSNWGDPLYQGDIAEVLFYNRRLTDTERAEVERYLHRKYFDYDEDGLLDTWELQYFGQIGALPGADADLDGLTNLQEYQLGGNPVDYFNRGTATVTPTLTIVAGNNQIGSTSTFSLNPLLVQLSGGGITSWENAPVTFAVTTGSGLLATTNVGAPQTNTSLTVLADATGQARVYYLNPASPQVGFVQAVAGASLSVSFSEETVNYWRPGILAAGTTHALSVKKDGTLWAWGENSSGQLGVGGTTSHSSPVRVSSLSGVSLVSAGAGHTIALKDDRTVWTWGLNQQGQLGDGSITTRQTPVVVNGLTDVMAIAAGGNHSVALKSDGTVWAWGADKTSSPVQVSSVGTAIAIAAGTYHTAVVKNDGTVWTWEAASSAAPVQANGLTGAVSVAVGEGHYLALDSSGHVWTWGSNASGQLGDGTTSDHSTPAMISSFSNVKAIAAHGQHSLALKNDGTVWAWGSNSQGEVGDGTTTNRTTPIQVTGLPVIAAIAAGDQFSMAICFDGSVWCWGKNDVGQLGIGSTTGKTVAFMNPRFFVTTELDENGDGVLDSWEMTHFGTTTVNLQEDADGDGMSNLQEYLEGSNPHDYYSQGSRRIIPVLTLIGGNNQVGAASTPTDNPLAVRVTDSLTGEPLDNATVTFTTTRGAGKVSASGVLGAQGYPSLEVHADGSGYANVYYQFPGSETQSGIISAVAGLAPLNAEVSFTATLLPPPEVAGLCLWLRADTGVTSDANGKVSGWNDLSASQLNVGQGNTNAQPSLVPNYVNGQPVISFSQANQSLGRGGIAGMPAGGDNRSVFMVIQYESSGWGGGFWYGNGIHGVGGGYLLGVTASGSLSFDAVESAVDLGQPAVGQGFVLQESVLQGNYLYNYKNGENLRYLCRALGTWGMYADLSVGGTVQQKIAEVMAYNRALNDSERMEVESYLARRYNLCVPKLYAPKVTPDGGVYTSTKDVTLSSPLSEVVIRYTTDGSEPSESSATYTSSFTVAASQTVKAKVYKRNFLPSDTYTANFTITTSIPITTSSLSFWLKADGWVEKQGDNSVTRWVDMSGNGRHALSSGLTGKNPLWVNQSINNLPVLRFDGTDDHLLMDGYWPGGTELSLFVVTKGERYSSLLQAQTSGGYLGYPWTDPTHFNHVIVSSDGGTTSGVSSGLVLSQSNIGGVTYKSGDRITTYRNGGLVGDRAAGTAALPSERLLLGSFMGQAAFSSADVAEIITYNRKLTQAERQNIEAYLSLKYNIPMAAPVANPDGGTFKTAQNVTLTPPTNAIAYYTTDTTEPTTASSSYSGPISISANTTLKVKYIYTNGAASATATVDYVIDPGIIFTTSNLQLWLEADRGIELSSGNSVSRWKDQSGHGLHASQLTTTIGQPLLQASAVNGKPSVQFDGTTSYLQMLPGFADFTQGLSIFVVASPTSTGSSARLIDLGNGQDNHNIFLGRSGTSQSLLYSTRIGNAGTDTTGIYALSQNAYQVISVTDDGITGGVRKLYKNSNLWEQGGTQTISSLTRTLNYIGKSNWNDSLYQGAIAEILVYNRRLSDTERQRVESYLAGKYAVPIEAPQGSTGGGMYSGTQTVTFNPPAGATLYYTLDGSDPTTNSTSYSGPITITEGTSIKARYYYDTGAVSDIASLDYFIDPSLPITGNGLQLWLRADIGVEHENSRVTRWRDLSGNSMHAFQQDPANLPTWIPQETDGHATIRFDGSTQFLRCPAGFADFTQGLTSFVIARPTSTASYARFLDFGGIGGRDSNNLILRREGTSQQLNFNVLQGGSTRSIAAPDTLTQNSLQMLAATHDGTSTGSAVIYKNGAVAASGTTWNIPNVTRYFNYIGKSNWPEPLYQGDISEVILYNRLLTATERKSVELYLAAKYAVPLPPPGITPDGGTFKVAQTVTLSVPVGAVTYYTLDGTDPTYASTSYSSAITINSSATLKAKSFYSNGAFTEVATTGFVIDPDLSIPTTDLSLWLMADTAIQKDLAGSVSQWKDQSGNANHAFQSATASRPISSIDVTTGKPTMKFNGAGHWMRIADSATLRPASQITIIAAINKNSDTNKYDKILSRPYRTSGWSSPYYSYGFGEENNNQTSFWVATTGAVARSLVPTVYLPNPGPVIYGVSYDGANQKMFLNGTLSATQAATGNLDYTGAGTGTIDLALGALSPYNLTNYFGGEINEVLMYNRALSDTERQAVETYLAKKYNIGLAAPLLSPDGGTFKDTQTVTVLNTPPDSVTRYTLNGDTPTAASTSYSGPITITASTTLKARNFYNNGALSEISTADFVINPVLPVPSSGLQLWLKADTAVETAPGSSTVTRWKDQSAGSRHAVQYLSGVRPTLAAGAINGLPAIHFDGATQFFQCLPGFADFTSGMTAIVVARPTASASNAKFFDFGNGSPSNNLVLSRDATTAALRLDLYTGGSVLALHAADGINALQPGLFQILQADYDGTQIRLYNDGYLQAQGRKQGSGGAIPNITRTLNYIGKSNWPLDALYQGDIAEILLYNRKLTDAERLAIQTYLVNRYTIGARTHTPAISPAGGDYPTAQAVTITCADMPTAEIHYTLDGTDPTINSPTYTGALNINRTTTVKATAIANGQDPSPIATAQFYINDTNHDGIDNTWATQNGVTSATADNDLDGLTNLQEYQLGSDPNNADTNGDGIKDGLAAKTGIPVTGVNTTSDRDRDGVPDYLDAYPDDPTKSTGDPGDTNPPTIQLTQPTNAVPVP